MGNHYDATPFIDSDPDVPAGWYGTWCRVTWCPRDGETDIRTAPFLDGELRTGTVTLGCGLDEWAREVGLTLPDAEMRAIRDIVDAQLVEQPSAEVVCRAGKARIELCPRPLWADGIGEPEQ
jgi:hypothetical protein